MSSVLTAVAAAPPHTSFRALSRSSACALARHQSGATFLGGNYLSLPLFARLASPSNFACPVFVVLFVSFANKKAAVPFGS